VNVICVKQWKGAGFGVPQGARSCSSERLVTAFPIIQFSKNLSEQRCVGSCLLHICWGQWK